MGIRVGCVILMTLFISVAEGKEPKVRMNPALCVATTDACVPNHFALLATPRLYDGYRLELDGFVSWGSGKLAFFVDSGQACNQPRGTGLELHLQSAMTEELKALLSRNGIGRVRISGILDADSYGERGGYVAVLRDASLAIIPRVHLAKTNPSLISREDDFSSNFLELAEVTCD